MNTPEYLCMDLFLGFLISLAVWLIVKVAQSFQATREERDEMGIITRDREIFEKNKK